MAIAVGLGALSLAVFAAGLLGWLQPAVIAALVTAPIALTVGVTARRQATPSLEQFAQWLRHPRRGVMNHAPIGRNELRTQPPTLSLLDRCLIGYCALALGLTFLGALAPPMGWDGLVYHLTGPKLYLAEGRILAGLDGVHFYFPPLADMLYLVGMALAGDVTSQVLHAGLLGLAAAAVYGLAAEELGRRTGLLAAAIFLSAPTWLLLGTQPYVDAGLALFVTLAFWAGRRWVRTGLTGWLTLSAVLAGFALGVKYTGAVFAVGLATAFFLARRPVAIGALVRWAAVACLVAAPWYLKNLAFTGNPFYPFLFGGWNMDAWRSAWYGQPGTGLLAEPVRLLLVPWEMTVLGGEGRIEYQATIGPLLLAAMPLALIGRRPALVGNALVFGGAVFALWLVGLATAFPIRQTRLVMPAFGLLAIAAAWGIGQLERAARPVLNPRRIATVLVVVALALGLAGQVSGFLAQMPLAFVVGAETREQYLTRLLWPHYPAMEMLEQRTPFDARVYSLWEPRSYHSQRAVQSDQLLDNWTRPLHRFGSTERIWSWLREQGYTHVLIYRGGLDYLLRWQHGEISVEQAEALVDFEQRYLIRLAGPPLELAVDGGVTALKMPPGGDYALYAIAH